MLSEERVDSVGQNQFGDQGREEAGAPLLVVFLFFGCVLSVVFGFVDLAISDWVERDASLFLAQLLRSCGYPGELIPW